MSARLREIRAALEAEAGGPPEGWDYTRDWRGRCVLLLARVAELETALRPFADLDPCCNHDRLRVLAAAARLALSDSAEPTDGPEPFCACGRLPSECDGSRVGCHTGPGCRTLTNRVSDSFCRRCKQRMRVPSAGERDG